MKINVCFKGNGQQYYLQYDAATSEWTHNKQPLSDYQAYKLISQILFEITPTGNVRSDAIDYLLATIKSAAVIGKKSFCISATNQQWLPLFGERISVEEYTNTVYNITTK
jgi:hypothetical protein